MAVDSGDRTEDRGERGEGTAEQGLDIFDNIATQIFVKRDLPVDPDWVAVIAGEFRGAMAQLHVEVKPEAPPPKPTRTVNATLMLLMAALENGDMWVRETRIGVRKRADNSTQFAPGPVEFDCGHMTVTIRYDAIAGGAEILTGRIERIALANGQLYSADKDDRRWLREYFPPVRIDMFSPAVQQMVDGLDVKARVVRVDDERRTWHWSKDTGHEPRIYKDAKGRVL